MDKCGENFYAATMLKKGMSLHDAEARAKFWRRVKWAAYAGLFLLFFAAAEEKARTPQPAVENSAWDGSVRQVKRWVQANIADPEAEVRKWGKVYRDEEGHLQVDAVIGGRNPLGGYITKPYRFRFSDKGVILKAAPVAEWVP